MLDKLAAVNNRFEELCARSEQPDFYNDPKKAAAILRERNDLEPIIEAYRAYKNAEQEMMDAEELMSDPEMKDKTILITSHGGICRVITSFFRDMENEEFISFAMHNCEYRLIYSD